MKTTPIKFDFNKMIKVVLKELKEIGKAASFAMSH